jgi:hypothetical protein
MNVVCIFAVREGKPDTLVAIVEHANDVLAQQVLLGWLRVNGYTDDAVKYYRMSCGPVIPWTPTMAEHPPIF